MHKKGMYGDRNLERQGAVSLRVVVEEVKVLTQEAYGGMLEDG